MKSIRLVSLGLAALLAAGALGGCKGSGDSDVKSPYDFEKYDPVVELTTCLLYTSFRYLKDRRLSGACFQDIGVFLYSDRSKGAVSDRRQTMAVWENLLAVSKEQLGTAAAEGGNAYVLRHADLVKNIRESSDSILFSDETVPFYQMVTHGSVLYTGEAVNLYYDETAQLLRLVEYGYTPRFELTYERAAELRDTAYNLSLIHIWCGTTRRIRSPIGTRCGRFLRYFWRLLPTGGTKLPQIFPGDAAQQGEQQAVEASGQHAADDEDPNPRQGVQGRGFDQQENRGSAGAHGQDGL